MWETNHDGVPAHKRRDDLLVGKLGWTHFDLDGQDGYFDVYIPTDDAQGYEWDWNYSEIYGVFHNVCSNFQGAYRTNDLLKSEYTFF
uniref:Uncharacterized protein n=1 Tax=Panagrolaimus sp. JU765 TaxID=591449 RepID=A0AC34RFD9_9BILA